MERVDGFNDAAAGWIDSLHGFVYLTSHFPAVLGNHKPLFPPELLLATNVCSLRQLSMG